MIFYEITAELDKVSKFESDWDYEQYIRLISAKQDAFYSATRGHSFLTLTRETDNYIGVLGIFNTKIDPSYLNSFWEAIGYDVKNIHVEETTFYMVRAKLREAYRNDYIYDESDIYFDFNISELDSHSYFPFDEFLAEENVNEIQLANQSREILCEADLIPEIERIFQG